MDWATKRRFYSKLWGRIKSGDEAVADSVDANGDPIGQEFFTGSPTELAAPVDPSTTPDNLAADYAKRHFDSSPNSRRRMRSRR